MTLHLVLFRPRAALSTDERTALIDALEHALTSIPLIKRARVGRRTTLGRLYDQMNAQDFPFVALLEFETEADLRAYLDHLAHDKLGEQFYLTSESALVYDFDLMDGTAVRELL